MAQKIIIACLLSGLASIAAGASLDVDELATNKAELDSLQQALAQVQVSQRITSLQADSLASRIAALKRKANSPFTEAALESALRQSQIIADSLQMLQQKQHRMDSLLRQKAEHLLKNLNAELQRLSSVAKQMNARHDQSAANRLAEQITGYRQWQRETQAILEQPPPKIIIYEVRAEPGDDNLALQRKADFLQDQADRLAREVRRFDKKLADLREEVTLRESMRDFAADLNIVEPLNEGLTGFGGSGAGAVAAEAEGRGFNQDGPLGPSAASTVTLAWPTQIEDLSYQQLLEWQQHLQQARHRFQTQADSLRTRAREFESQQRTPR